MMLIQRLFAQKLKLMEMALVANSGHMVYSQQWELSQLVEWFTLIQKHREF